MKGLRAVVYVCLSLAALLMVMPLVWLVAATTKGSDDLLHFTFFATQRAHLGPLNFSWLKPFSSENFVSLFTAIPFARYMLNSVFISCTTVVMQLFFSSLAGFALAKYEFRGKKFIMLLMLATVMIPSQVTMAPLYELIYRMGLIDTYPGLLIPSAVNVFGIFLFRQAILQVPDEMLHAARIDGCSEFRIYWDIVMPVSRPMVGAFCLISFMAAWNNFLWPQIILHSKMRLTLPIGLNQLVGPQSQLYGALMAGTFLSILPVIILFLLLQKEFVAGLTSGAVKG